jgi:AcrR family transcriptional regulator
MKKPTVVAPRRSQEERRAATIAKLVDATIETIMKVGYARTTVKEVCARAQLSHGALFRFFPTMLDLIMAAAEEIAERQVASFERKWDAHRPEALYESLVLLRESCRSPTNQVFYELLVAARTDADLRRALRPGIERLFGIMRASARKVQALAALPPELFDTLLFSAIHLFDGESLVRKIYAQPEQEEHRMALLRTLVATMTKTP